MFNITPTESIGGIISQMNSLTDNGFGIALLLLVPIIAYILTARMGFEKPILPAALFGFVGGIFIYLMELISAEILVFTLIFFALVTVFTWGSSN